MVKIKFVNRFYHYGLITFIILVILVGIYAITALGVIRMIVHTVASLIVLILVLQKHRYAKLAIKIWSGVFLILAGVLVLLEPLTQVLGIWLHGERLTPATAANLIYGLLNLALGLLVFLGARYYIKRETDSVKIEDHLIQ